MDRKVVEVSSLSFLLFSLSLCFSLFLSFSLSLSLSLIIDLPTYRSIYLSIHPSIYIFLNCGSNCVSSYLPIYHLSIDRSIDLSIYLSIFYQSINQSIYLSVCLFVCLSIYLSICQLENQAILRDVLIFRSWQYQKRSNFASNSARLIQCLNLTTSKTSNSARLPSKIESWVQRWQPRTNAFCDFSTPLV